jgi:hypothetical protein
MWEGVGGELVRSVIEKLSLLTDITYWFYPKLRTTPCCAQFTFGSISFWVTVRGEDDTVEILSSAPPERLVSDSGYSSFLTEKIRGLRMTWARIMINQQGYTDGFQMDFNSEDQQRLCSMELVALASTLEIRYNFMRAEKGHV